MAQIKLSDMIVGLRKELQEAQKKAAKEKMKFTVENIVVEAQVKVTVDAEAKGSAKWKFWVFSEAAVEASGGIARESVQTIRLTLKPSDDGGDLKVAGKGSRPKRKG